MVAIRHPIVAGIDVHAATFVVSLRRQTACNEPVRELRKFGTALAHMQRLRDWLLASRCLDVVMESTGCYWIALHRMLTAAGIRCVVGNPAHIRQIPGKKTDDNDAAWLADLHACGLVRASFVPPPDIVPLRDFTRMRVHYIEERTRIHNMINQRLEESGVRLRQVVRGSGLTVQRLIRAIAGNVDDPEELADLRDRRCEHTREEFREALAGIVPGHTRDIIRMLLGDLATVADRIREIDVKLRELFRPFDREVRLLMTIPSIGIVSARTIIAECGPTMREFTSEKHVASFAGLCPGNNESAGKRHGGKTRHGNRYLRRVLSVAASSSRQRPWTLPGQKLLRLSDRIGKMKAPLAVAHWLLRIAWRVLTTGIEYSDLCARPGGRTNGTREANRLQQRVNRAINIVEAAGHTVMRRDAQMPAT